MSDSFSAIIRAAHTGGPNYGLDTETIIARLTKWQTLCSFRVIRAEGDAVDIRFETLPKDMDAFVRVLYECCTDLVDQGTGIVGEMIEEMDEVPAQMQKLIKGVDFEDEDYGLEILKREIQQKKAVTLWWD